MLAQEGNWAAAEQLRGACATPDVGAQGGAPLMRARLSSRARGGPDEVCAEVLLPVESLNAPGSNIHPILHKVREPLLSYQIMSSDHLQKGVVQTTLPTTKHSLYMCCVTQIGTQRTGSPQNIPHDTTFALAPQVMYAINSGQHTSGKLVVGRGRGDDVVSSLNPVAGRGLTHLLRFGSAVHQRVSGSGVGGTLRLHSRCHASCAHMISDGAGEPRPPCPPFLPAPCV